MIMLCTLLCIILLGVVTSSTVEYDYRGPICVSNCTGMADDDYQSCNGCNMYVTCSNELITEDRMCAADNLLWDDITKTCEYKSFTCPCSYTEQNNRDIYCGKQDMKYIENTEIVDCITRCSNDDNCHSMSYHTDRRMCHLNFCHPGYFRNLGNAKAWVKGFCQ